MRALPARPVRRRGNQSRSHVLHCNHSLRLCISFSGAGAVNVLRRMRRCSAELLAEERSQRLVDVQCLGRVAACRERLHQIPVTALPEGSLPDEDSRSPLGGVELAAADPEARLGSQLESAEISDPRGHGGAPRARAAYPLLGRAAAQRCAGRCARPPRRSASPRGPRPTRRGEPRRAPPRRQPRRPPRAQGAARFCPRFAGRRRLDEAWTRARRGRSRLNAAARPRGRRSTRGESSPASDAGRDR